MDTIERVTLKEIVRFKYGASLTATDRDPSGNRPVFGSNGPVGTHSDSLIDFPTIIVGRKDSAGSVFYAPDGGWPIDTTYYTEIIDIGRVDLRYLFYALKRAQLGSLTITTSIPGLNRESLYRIQIPLPPLEQQKRIAAILDKADAIRRKRLDAIKVSTHLVKVVFDSLFGDCVTNAKNLPECEFQDLCGKIVDCPHSAPTYANRETEFACVRSIDIQDGYIDWNSTKHVEQDEYRLRIARHTPRTGEVLYTRGGGRMGNAARIPEDSKVCLGQRMMLFGAKESETTTEFLWALLNSPGMRHQVKTLTAGAAAPRINISDIRKMKAIFPPFDVQLLFSRFVKRIEELRRRQFDAANEESDLFQSLVQRAFQGEL